MQAGGICTADGSRCVGGDPLAIGSSTTEAGPPAARPGRRL